MLPRTWIHDLNQVGGFALIIKWQLYLCPCVTRIHFGNPIMRIAKTVFISWVPHIGNDPDYHSDRWEACPILPAELL